MTKKPTYEELEQRVKELEKEAVEHKRAKQELQTILNVIPVIIFQKDRDGKTIQTNQAFDNMIGLSKEEIIGKTTDELFPEYGKDMIKDDQEVMESGKPKLDIIEHYDSPEGTRWARTGKAPLKDKKGNVVGLIGYAADITEQKQIEEALRESEEKWRSLVENAPGFIINVDRDGTIQFINRGVPGITAKEATGQSVYKYIEPEYQNTARETIEQVFKTGKPSNYVVKGIGPDCHHISWYQTQAGPIKHDNQVIAATLITTDITERKRTEWALQESEEKYRTLFENANDAIIIADRKTDIILDANRQAQQLIGRPREEIIGMHQSELYPPHYAEYYRDKFRRHLQKGRILDLKAEIITKDGSIVPVFISLSVITLHGKEVIQGLFRDITEEKRILDLKEEVAARRLIEKAKGVLVDRHKINEKEAMRRLQKESRRQRKKIKEIAQAVISSDLILN